MFFLLRFRHVLSTVFGYVPVTCFSGQLLGPASRSSFSGQLLDPASQASFSGQLLRPASQASFSGQLLGPELPNADHNLEPTKTRYLEDVLEAKAGAT
jgi:hypothetical protein